MSEPSAETFQTLRKDDLVTLAKHVKIDVRPSLRKRDIQKAVMEHLVNQSIFEQSALDPYKTVENQSTTRSNSVLTLAESPEVNQGNSEEKERERQWQREQEEIQWKREREKREWEREERQFKLREQELELQKLELQTKAGHQNTTHASSHFDFTKHIRMVPPFQEREVDKYFLHFEKVAKNCTWPKEHWTMLLQSVLIGKARDIYSELSVELSGDYDTVKELILKGYELVPEAYRQKFRNLERNGSKTYVQFAQEKEQLFDRWCLSENADKEYKRLRELMLLEEFKRCIGNDIRTFINEQKPKDLTTAARLADEFALTHKFSTNRSQSQTFRGSNVSNFESKATFRNFSRNYPENTNNLNSDRFMNSKFREQSLNNNYNNNNYNNNRSRYVPPPLRQPETRAPFKTLTCGYCRGEGHTMSNCFKLKNKEHQKTKPTGAVSHNSSIDQKPTEQSVDPVDPVMKVFQPFIFDGSVSFKNDQSPVCPIKILRDTGASQSLILTKTLPFSTNSYSGKNVLIQGINAQNYTSVPLHYIKLESKLVSGEVQIGIIDSLPFEGIHLILGNDLAGSKVKVVPILSDKPVIHQKPDPLEDDIPNLYPSCAVTRAMSKRKQFDLEDADNGSDLSDTFLQKLFENSENSENFSKSNLVIEQQNDPEISALIQNASDETDASKNSICYFMKNGILMRKWRPSDVSADDTWQVRTQIVIPKTYRSEVLSLAHETPLSGHLGINKTYQKIINHFTGLGFEKMWSNFVILATRAK